VVHDKLPHVYGHCSAQVQIQLLQQSQELFLYTSLPRVGM
jgi:hypothetical protein